MSSYKNEGWDPLGDIKNKIETIEKDIPGLRTAVIDLQIAGKKVQADLVEIKNKLKDLNKLGFNQHPPQEREQQLLSDFKTTGISINGLPTWTLATSIPSFTNNTSVGLSYEREKRRENIMSQMKDLDRSYLNALLEQDQEIMEGIQDRIYVLKKLLIEKN